MKNGHGPPLPFKWPETLQERQEREQQHRNDLRDKLITSIAVPCDAMIAELNYAFILQGIENNPKEFATTHSAANRLKAKYLKRMNFSQVNKFYILHYRI